MIRNIKMSDKIKRLRKEEPSITTMRIKILQALVRASEKTKYPTIPDIMAESNRSNTSCRDHLIALRNLGWVWESSTPQKRTRHWWIAEKGKKILRRYEDGE